MWPFHYLLPTVKILSSNCKEAHCPPPGRQLRPPHPRTLNSSRFCTTGWGRQHKRQILGRLCRHEGQPRGSSVLLPALEVRVSQRAQPVASPPPTDPSALPGMGLPPAAPAGAPVLLCLRLTSTSSLPSPVPCPGCLSSLNLQQGLQLWFSMPGPSSVSYLVLPLTAYPHDFPGSSFSYPCAGTLNAAVSSVPPLLPVP